MATTSTDVCNCPHCRVAAAGLPAGPYTPAEYARIAPPVVVSAPAERLTDDPKVQAAIAERDEARGVFDAANALWIAAVAEHQTAVLMGGDPYERDATGKVIGKRSESASRARIAELASDVKVAEKRRLLAWDVVVECNDRIRRAQERAQASLVRAGRPGTRSGSRP